MLPSLAQPGDSSRRLGVGLWPPGRASEVLTVKELCVRRAVQVGRGQRGQGLASPFSPVSFRVTDVLAPAPLPLLSFPFFFTFFILLRLFPFHPLPLPAPPPQLLWQQLNARNKGGIQLGHQFPKQHPSEGGVGPAGPGLLWGWALWGGAPTLPQKGHCVSRRASLLWASGSSEYPSPPPRLRPGPFLRLVKPSLSPLLSYSPSSHAHVNALSLCWD